MILVRGRATSVTVFVLLLNVLPAYLYPQDTPYIQLQDPGYLHPKDHQYPQDQSAQPSHNVGCVFAEQVCYADEQCFDDGVLGRCISPSDEHVQQHYRTGPLSSSDLHLLAAEMKRVLSQGFSWEDDYSQCVFQALVEHINFKIDYTPDECDHLLNTNDLENNDDAMKYDFDANNDAEEGE